MCSAVRWFALATNDGHAAAQFRHGEFYTNGRGAPKDCVETHKWFSLAFENGNADGGRDILEAKAMASMDQGRYVRGLAR